MPIALKNEDHRCTLKTHDLERGEVYVSDRGEVVIAIGPFTDKDNDVLYAVELSTGLAFTSDGRDRTFRHVDATLTVG